MTKTTTLMLLAASLAPLPLFAEEHAPAADCFAKLIAPAQSSAMTLQQRAEQFAAAAILPADVDMALVMPRREQCGEQNKCMLNFPDIPHADSIALGLAKGTGNSLAALNAFTTLMQMPQTTDEAAAEWREDARESLKELISRGAENVKQKSLAQAAQMAEQIAIQPIYLITSPKVGEENEFRQSMKVFVDFLSVNATAIPGAKPVEVDGLKGVQFSLDDATELSTVQGSDDVENLLIREFSKRSLCFLIGMKGDKIVCVLCEHPEDVRWAESAEQSVLATEAWSTLSTCPDAPTALVATLSPAMYSAAQLSMNAPYNIVLQELNDLFNAMAGKESADADVFRAAITGLNTIASEIAALQQPITKAATVQVQESGQELRISLQTDANGFSYKPGQLRLTSLANSPQGILYCESTEMQYRCKPDGDKLLRAAEAALDGGLATLRQEKRSEISTYMQCIKSYEAELQETRQALITIGEGLGNTSALVVDATEQVPTFLSGQNGTAAVLPRIAFYSGVTDRAKLASGWDMLVSTAGKALDKNGLNPQLVSTLPITAASADGTAAYSLVMPFLTADMGGNVTVSDTAFTIGTSSNLNGEIVKSATGTMPFAGAVFSVNFGQLAKTARSIADLSRTACCGEDEDDNDEDNMADEAESVAETLENISSLFENMTGTSTIRDGVQTIRMDFRKK